MPKSPGGKGERIQSKRRGERKQKENGVPQKKLLDTDSSPGQFTTDEVLLVFSGELFESLALGFGN